MKKIRSFRKGSLLVISVSFMYAVSILVTNQLESLKISYSQRKSLDYQRVADIAARSGIDYGYSMIKHVMEGMSLVELRFSHRFYKDSGFTGEIAEVLPSWQEILNVHFDHAASLALGTANEKNWPGTDIYDLGKNIENGSASDPAAPIDQDWAVAGNKFTYPDGLGGADDGLRTLSAFSSSWSAASPSVNTLSSNREIGFGLGTADTTTLRSCAKTSYSIAAGPIQTYYLNLGDLSIDECMYNDAAMRDISNSALSGLETFEINMLRAGHFGTRRWHYYDAFDFADYGGDALNIGSDIDGQGTGGIIRANPANLLGGATYFADHHDIFFDRLFNYRRDTVTLQAPYEPIDVTKATLAEMDQHKNAYHVQMQTVVDLDNLDPLVAEDQALMNHTDYSVIRYKVFFKLWVTRDENRDAYGLNPGGSSVITTAFWPDSTLNPVDLRDWKGNTFSSLASGGGPLDIDGNVKAKDLHPVWSIPRNSGTINGVAIDQTSYYKPDYLLDFLDTDADGDTNHRLGALQFPVPYLAYQRGDHDYWPDFDPMVPGRPIRGTTDTLRFTKDPLVPNASMGIPVDHPHYTKFTLWSLGTVREIDEDFIAAMGGSYIKAESSQSLSHFKVVARSLYRLDFYMDVRATDVNDEFSYARIASGSYDVNVCNASYQNENNDAYWAAMKVPECDIDALRMVKNLFEPTGIYVDQIRKVAYRSSKK